MSRRFLAICALIVVLRASVGLASPKIYETGKLLSVQSPEIVIPMPPPLPSLPLHLTYQFEVQQGDIVYVGYCQRREYKAEWRVGNDVQFRLKKDKMYLKRPNGKEFVLTFLLQAKLGADGKAITILQYKKAVKTLHGANLASVSEIAWFHQLIVPKVQELGAGSALSTTTRGNARLSPSA